MGNINFNEDKKKYEAIEVPKDLTIDILKGMKRGRKVRTIKKSIPICSLGTIFLAFFLTVNTSISFAEAMRNIPVIKDFTNIILVNEGIKYALDEGYIQYVNKSCEIDGVKVTITRIIGDKRKLIFGYTVEGERTDKDSYLGLRNLKIKDAGNNEDIKAMYGYGTGDYKKDGLKPLKNERYFSLENVESCKMPKEIIIIFDGIINHSKFIDGEEEEISDSEFKIPIELEEKIINVEPEVYEVKKLVELGEQELYIDEIKVYPMTIELMVDRSVNDVDKLVWLDNCYIEDEKGKIFTLSSGSEYEKGKYIMSFNGGAYKKSKELILYSNGMYYNPKEKREIILDLKNKKLVSGEEYGIQFDDIKIYKEAKIEGEESHYEVITEDYNSNSIRDTKKEQKEYVYEGIEVSLKTIPEHELTNVSLNHEEAIRYGTSTRDGVVTDISIYFEEQYLREQEYLHIDISSAHSEKMKTEPFSIKLK